MRGGSKGRRMRARDVWAGVQALMRRMRARDVWAGVQALMRRMRARDVWAGVQALTFVGWVMKVRPLNFVFRSK